MPEYGVTKTGVNIKRLDTIMDEMHSDLSKGWDVNTRLNPKSFLNVMLTDFGDKIAELWEFGKGIYDSMYPSSAEGINLDNACQFGGTVREVAARSYYPIHCTGVDGTPLDTSTIIASDTNPQVNLILLNPATITRSSFNRVAVKVVSLASTAAYTVSIDGTLYSYTPPEDPTILGILCGIQTLFDENEDFVTYVDEEAMLLYIEARDVEKSFMMILTENLTTETVVSIITFATEQYGDVILPEGSITKKIQGHAGFLRCTNLCPYIAGRQQETDRELRGSYVDKIYNRSSRMLESIRSGILMNCQGVTSVAPYENATHEWYVDGTYISPKAVDGTPPGYIVRPPHSVEIVVDGGNSTEIAKQILANKAGGINTVGQEDITIPGQYGEPIHIRFNRPTYVYTWLRVGITQSQTEPLPPNFAKLIKNAIVDQFDGLNCGDAIVPQKFLDSIYTVCSGISYIDITMYTTTDRGATPDGYNLRSRSVSARERAVTNSAMIEVALDG